MDRLRVLAQSQWMVSSGSLPDEYFLLKYTSIQVLCRLLPHFIQSGQESISRSAIVLGELPLPNQSTLQILLETLHR